MTRRYSTEPEDKRAFTEKYDRVWTRAARAYDVIVKTLPLWKSWIGKAVPEIRGPRVLDVSFGTGYLLTRYAQKFEVCGIDYNARMVRTAQRNVREAGLRAELQRASVEAIPYQRETFDTVVNTMAFSGYPDGKAAMSEMRRVLKAGGRLVMIDVDYPSDGNRTGTFMTNLWKNQLGAIIRDVDSLFLELGFEHTDREIGGFGSIHLYVAEKLGLSLER
ncbi:MAG: class I SAM-dependent methyltransferase [Chloroflexi bacterium]|nr:class I SAM-dependent methyltransferase [Chloroflexota bacterium]